MRHDGDRCTRFARSGELASLFKHGALAIGIPTRTARGESIGLRSAGSFAERLERLWRDGCALERFACER